MYIYLFIQSIIRQHSSLFDKEQKTKYKILCVGISPASSEAKQSKAKQNKAKQSKAKQSKAKQSKAKQSKAKQNKKQNNDNKNWCWNLPGIKQNKTNNICPKHYYS